MVFFDSLFAVSKLESSAEVMSCDSIISTEVDMMSTNVLYLGDIYSEVEVSSGNAASDPNDWPEISLEGISKDREVQTIDAATQTYEKGPTSTPGLCGRFFPGAAQDLSDIEWYTGLDSVEKVQDVVGSLNPQNLQYPSSFVPLLSFDQQIMLTLIKLRRNVDLEELEFMFNVSEDQVKEIFHTCVTFIAHEWSRFLCGQPKTEYYIPAMAKRMYRARKYIFNFAAVRRMEAYCLKQGYTSPIGPEDRTKVEDLADTFGILHTHQSLDIMWQASDILFICCVLKDIWNCCA